MSGSAECFDMNGFMQNMRSLSAQQGGIIKAIALSNAKSNEVKQKANGLIAKLNLDWATQDVIDKAQILRIKHFVFEYDINFSIFSKFPFEVGS
jgi:hypothetical protein